MCNSSTTSTASSSSSATKCGSFCEKLLKLRWRRHYVDKALEMESFPKFGGFTNIRYGPPKTLTTEEEQSWRTIMKEAWRNCTRTILLPHIKSKEGIWEKKLVDSVKSIDSEEKYNNYVANINKGIVHARQKYSDKYLVEKSVAPLQPRKNMKIGDSDKQNIQERSSNFIQRGEKFTAVGNGFVKNVWLKERSNVFIILAHAIYNRTKLHSLLVRNFWAYIDYYEEVEKYRFRPFIGELNNGQRRYVDSWNKFRILIKNRDLKVTRYEIEIIARLYDVNIRIMHDISENNSPWVVREKYACVWSTQAKTGRVVNLLEQKNGTWAMLEGIEYNYNWIREVREVEPHIIIGEPKESDKTEVSDISEVIRVNVASIDNEEIEDKSEKNIRQMATHEENIRDNTSELGSIITTDSVNALFYEDRDSDYQTSTKNYKTEDSDNSEVIRAYVDSIDDEEIEKLGEKPIQQTATHERSIKENNSEISSTKTTASVGALFYEDRDSDYDTHIRTLNREVGDKQVDTLTLSRFSNATINTLPSIDSVENSYLNMQKRISSTKTNNKQKQASKVSLKNALWQRCRVLERDRRRNENKQRENRDIREGKKLSNNNIVFDFTSKGLDSEEIELLSKGESFSIAKDKVDEDRLKVDLYNYTRRLRLHDEFVVKQEEQDVPVGLSQFSRVTRSQTGSLSDHRRSSSVLSTYDQSRPRSSNSVQRSRSSVNPMEANINTQYSKRTSSTSQNCREDVIIDNKEVDRKGCRNNEIASKHRSLPSTYDPVSDNRNLIRYNNCIQEEGLLVTRNKTPFKDNITPQLRKALSSLKEKVTQKEIIITKADKGSGLVILDYDLYIQKGTYYIEEESGAYEKVNDNQKDIIEKIVKERNKIAVRLRKADIIKDQTTTYCTHQIEEKITGMKFYYKVHKDSNIKTMPLRPLQSCISGPTHHLSQVLTDLLQPFLTVKNIPTFIQDSNQLLLRLSKLPMLDKNATIITSDVAALYPSIPHKEGLDAMKTFLTTASMYSENQIKLVIQALELVITRNYVKWNGEIYEQTKGVAMGTPVAVAYANIFMHWVDMEINKKATYIIEHMRYIDDNLFIIPEEKIDELIKIANSILSPSIRYTYEALDKDSEVGLPFLDTQLFISDEYTIESRLYTKKTDKHAYLLPSSYHPTHITSNIPLSTFYRLRRICSREEWFQADVIKAIGWLEDRDYRYKDITKAIGKAIDKDRWELIESIEDNRGSRKRRKEEEANTIPLVVTYSQKTLKLKEVLQRRQDILDASFGTQQVKPRISFRRQDNIGDLLVQRSLRGPIGGMEQVESKFRECNIEQKYRIRCPCKGVHDQRKCRCCIHACFEPKDIKVRLYKEVTCDSRNVVYLISCKICKKRYVGETQQRLRDRFTQHLNNIQKLNQPLYIHFRTVHKPEEISITVLETVKSIEPFMRKIREAWWINCLQTLEPKGFNAKLDCNQVYVEDKALQKREPRGQRSSKQ